MSSTTKTTARKAPAKKAAKKKAPTARKAPAKKAAKKKAPTAQEQLAAVRRVLGRLDELVEAMKPGMHSEALDEAAALQAEIRALDKG